MLGTDRVGDVDEGEIERIDRLGLKNEVNLDEVFEKDEDRPCGAVDDDDLPVAVVRDWDEVVDLDALLRTIPSVERSKPSLRSNRIIAKSNGRFNKDAIESRQSILDR